MNHVNAPRKFLDFLHVFMAVTGLSGLVGTIVFVVVTYYIGTNVPYESVFKIIALISLGWSVYGLVSMVYFLCRAVHLLRQK